MNIRVLFCKFVAVFASFLFSADFAKAELITFTVTGGSLALSGNSSVQGFGGPFSYTQQSNGSLTTTYGGSFVVDVNNVLTPSTIAFNSGAIDANVSGVYSPNDAGDGQTPTGPADYGITVANLAANGKLRNIVFGVTQVATPVTTGSFAVGTQTWAYTSGNIDVFSSAPQLNNGTTATLVGTSSNTNALTGSYSVVGNTITVTLPVTISFAYTLPGPPDVTGVNTYTGTLTAVAAVPEPTSILMCSLIGVCGLAFRRRTGKSSSREA